MSEYPTNPDSEITNDQLFNFAVSRIDFTDKQKRKLQILLSEEEAFRERLTTAYKIFHSQDVGEEDKKNADLLLESIRSDIETILEIEG